MYKTLTIRLSALLCITVIGLCTAFFFVLGEFYVSYHTLAYVEQPHQPTVYITFDDGPSKVTPKILDTLDELGIKATFFVMANEYDWAPDIYRRIVDEGHAIGIHTYSHQYDRIYQSKQSYLSDFQKIDDFIFAQTGVRTKIWRFPGGSCNINCNKWVMKSIIQELQGRGYVYFDWNSLAKDDTSHTISAQEILQNIITTAKIETKQTPMHDIVILMHDNAIRTSAPDAIPLIVEHFTTLGYQFDKLTEHTTPVQYIKVEESAQEVSHEKPL